MTNPDHMPERMVCHKPITGVYVIEQFRISSTYLIHKIHKIK